MVSPQTVDWIIEEIRRLGIRKDRPRYEESINDVVKNFVRQPDQQVEYFQAVKEHLTFLEGSAERLRARLAESDRVNREKKHAVLAEIAPEPNWQEFPTDPHHPANLTPPIEVYDESEDNPQLDLPGFERGGPQRAPRPR